MFCHAVSHELTAMDKALLESEGVCLAGEKGQRKRKQRRDGVEREMKPDARDGIEREMKPEARDGIEGRWCEVKRYLDPNPQLKGVDLGRYAAKVGSADLDLCHMFIVCPVLHAEQVGG